MRVESAVRRFVAEAAQEGSISDDPLAEGLLDSLALEYLLSCLESTFRIAFDVADLVAANFGSIETVVALVERKLLVRT